MSVVIPVYNNERYLGEAIESVLAQTYSPHEIVAVDDGSTDGSAGVVRSFPTVRYVYQPNGGNAAARNAGVAAARGAFVAFLDADDLWTPEKSSAQVGHLRDHPEVGYALAWSRSFLEDGAELPAWMTEEMFATENPAVPSALVVRKSVFYEVGEFDRGYVAGSDLDWLVRARDAGVRSFLVPETLVHKRTHDSNLSSEVRLARRELLKISRGSINRKKRGTGDR